MIESTFKFLLTAHAQFSPSPWPSLPKHPLVKEAPLILPAFLGEMGSEVRGFLGQIEPFLRTGWKIPARRVAFYPSGSAFSDPEYFARIDNIIRHFNLRKIFSRLACFNDHPLTISLSPKDDWLELTLCLKKQRVEMTALVERELKKAWFDRYGTPERAPTRWHKSLNSVVDDNYDELAYSSMVSTPPSYLPSAYTHPRQSVFKHIGVQLRQMTAEPERNSDPLAMRPVLQKLTDLLQLPVLVYGLASDGTMEGYQRTLDLMPNGVEQMDAELAYLSQCRLMLSPDSGWADLMGWLRVPTVLQGQLYPFGFECLRPFKPKIALLPASLEELPAVVKQLLQEDDSVVLPDPHRSTRIESHLSPVGRRGQWDSFRK